MEVHPFSSFTSFGRCYLPSVIFSAEEFVVDARHAAMSSFNSTNFDWTYSNEFFIIAYRMSYDCEFFSYAQFCTVLQAVDVAVSGDWSVEGQYGVLISHNTPYCLEERIRRLDCRIQYVVLGRRFDTPYPTGGYGISERGDGVAGFKRRRQDFYGDGVEDLTTASGRSQLKPALEDSTWRQRRRTLIILAAFRPSLRPQNTIVTDLNLCFNQSIFSLCYLFRNPFSLTSMGDKNHIHTLGDYSIPSHEGYRNSIELPEGNNVAPLRSDTIRLVQNECLFHGLRSENPNQHLKDFLKLVDSLNLDVASRERMRLRLFQFSIRDQAINWLERFPTGSISTWEDLTTCFLA
ncbi:hypothetical protein Tco_0152570 [Tanacetum coccineum]